VPGTHLARISAISASLAQILAFSVFLASLATLPTVSPVPFFDPMFYLFKTTDLKNSSGRYVVTTDIVWQYDNEDDAQDAADQYNSNLSNAGIPSWVCCYYVAS